MLPTSTVLVVEDVHLMDDASADLLHRMSAELGDRPWLVLVTRREQPVGFVPDPEQRLSVAAAAAAGPRRLLSSSSR